VLVPEFEKVVRKLEQQFTLRGQSKNTLSNYIRRIALFVVHFGKLSKQINPEETKVCLPTNKECQKQLVLWLFCIFRMTEKHINLQYVKEHFSYFSSKNCKIVFKYIALNPAGVAQSRLWRDVSLRGLFIVHRFLFNKFKFYPFTIFSFKSPFCNYMVSLFICLFNSLP